MWSSPIGDVQPAGGSQHPNGLGERPALAGGVDVVQQQQRHDQRIGAGIVGGQLTGEAPAPHDRNCSELALGQREDLGVTVDADHLHVGSHGGQRDRERAHPATHNAAKRMLPAGRADTIIRLRGTTLRARWNARRGPPERSGTLYIGRGMLDGIVEANDVLTITIGDDGRIELN